MSISSPQDAAPRRLIHTFEDQKAVIEAAAELVISLANLSIQERGRFSLVLAGGSTPRGLYERLAEPSMSARIDWTHVHIFLGDERAVEAEHELSNIPMARKSLLDKVPIPSENIHLPNGSVADRPSEAARYAGELKTMGPLDLVLLGMGRDGHTASLFPHSPALDEKSAWFVATPPATQEPFVPRLTLTFPAINAARTVLFLVTGEDKAEPLAACVSTAETAPGIHELPSRGVHPLGTLHFYVDYAAARNIETPPS